MNTCNKCNRIFIELEIGARIIELEIKEQEEEKSFTCSDCINEEMDALEVAE